MTAILSPESLLYNDNLMCLSLISGVDGSTHGATSVSLLSIRGKSLGIKYMVPHKPTHAYLTSSVLSTLGDGTWAYWNRILCVSLSLLCLVCVPLAALDAAPHLSIWEVLTFLARLDHPFFPSLPEAELGTSSPGSCGILIISFIQTASLFFFIHLSVLVH